MTEERKHSLFTSSVKRPDSKKSYPEIVATMLLGKSPKSKELVNFIDLCLKLLVDNGPHVSGSVNTMISARAGKDLVSSLCAGLLTIGDRFGGATNQAAKNWHEAISKKTTPKEFVEQFNSQKEYIAGIGHKQYTIFNPDERVKEMAKIIAKIKSPHYDFAKSVEKITTGKKANLILNVDGAMAAILLDLLAQKEKFGAKEITELIEIEFFNALFVISRTVGFAAHYLDQKRLDEGLFRLRDEDVLEIS